MTSKLLGVLVLAAAVVVVAVAGTGAKKDAPPFPLNHVDSLIGKPRPVIVPLSQSPIPDPQKKNNTT